MTATPRLLLLLLALAALPAACADSSDPAPTEQCVLGATAPDYAPTLGCRADFLLLASRPLDASIPGARSVKTVLDRSDANRLHFQNSTKYPIHWDFAHAHLSAGGLPIVGDLTAFNQVEYFSPDRRFVLGAVTWYEGPDLWVYEVAPYDTASADLITQAFDAIAAAGFFGPDLYFHPNSSIVALAAADLPPRIPQISTDDIFAGIDYQPLNLTEGVGRLRFVPTAELATTYLDFREIVVLDQVPNDLSSVSGIITEAFQTPLSHINVLSQNRGTPNMGLRGAMSNGELRGLEGRWVRLTVGAFNWTIEEVTREVADAWWEAHRPSTVQVPQMDLSRDQVTPISQVLPTGKPEKEALKEAIRAFGGKASHYAILATLPQVPTPEAFAIPVYFYNQFLESNGFKTRIQALLADQAFLDSPATRDEQLRLLRDDMKVAPLDPAFLADLEARLAADFPGLPMRFRSSTNAEDLEGFTGAGLYTSKTADPGDPNRSVADAIRKVWASVWSFRAFEERSFRNIDHLAVGMALLVHRSYPEEEAAGVALTANPFDATGIEPAWYINVQAGDVSVVNPDPGITTDVILLFYGSPGQPISYLAHSNLVPPGQTVLTDPQVRTLGDALAAIHQHFLPIYGPAVGQASYYAMDVEFKFEDFGTGQAPQLQVKQARPHSGWGAQP